MNNFEPIEEYTEDIKNEESTEKTNNSGKIIIAIFAIVFVLFIFLLIFGKKSTQTLATGKIIERPAPTNRVKMLNIVPCKSVITAGKKFHFTISRELIFSGNLGNVIVSFYVPSSINGRQKIENLVVNPKPKKIEKTEDGDIAYLEFKNPNGPVTISMSGTARVIPYDLQIAQREKKNLDGELSKKDREKYTSAEKKIETNNIYFQKYCAKHIPSATNQADTVKNIFDYVATILQYNLNDTGKNKGALYGLQTRSGVCMEFAELMTAFCRMKGIPSRVVYGFNIPFDKEYLPSETGHAWVEVYFPEYGWVDFDPTHKMSRDLLKKASSLQITPYELLSKVFKDRMYLKVNTMEIYMDYDGQGDIVSKNLKIKY